jgi:cell division septation protein DedD
MDWVKQKMQHARLQRDQIRTHGAFTDSDNGLRSDSYAAGNRLSGFFAVTHKLPWLAAGMALGGVIVIMVWKSGLVGLNNSSIANVIPGGMTQQQRSFVEQPSQFSATDTKGLRNDIALLAEQVQALTTSVSDLKIKLQSIHAVTDSIAALGNELAPGASQQLGAISDTVTRSEPLPSPVADTVAQLEALQSPVADTVSRLEALPSPATGTVTRLETLPSPAAGSGNVSSSIVKDAGKSGDASNTTLAAVNAITPAAPGIQHQETIAGNGPWVINLVSIPNKIDAERFMEKAQSRGVAAGLYQVTVKGTDYWRVQVSGFSSAAEAKSEARQVKEKLGIKDVWVAKQ